MEGLPTGFDWSTRSPDQRGFPDLWNRVSQASPLPGSGGPLPSHLVFVPPGPSIGQAPIEARFPGDAPRQARASLAYSTASPGARARRSRITPPCQARGPPRSRALPRRACCCVFYRLARRVGVDVNARPTASRACCCVFYRLARRAGVDVRAPYCAARLLSRILPPRQARGRRRSRVLPRRALAVAYSTASPGARASTFACPTASRALTVARSTAPGTRASTFACSTASRACCCVFYRLARSRACCRVFYRLARRAGVDVRASDRAAAYCRVYPTASPGARASTFARPIASRAYCHVLCQGLTGKQALRQRECLSRKVFRALSLDVWASHLVFCCSWALDRPGSDRGTIPKGTRHARRARRSRTLPPRQGRARARRSRITPPCQARGPPRSRALPRRALAVACSTVSPGARASTLTRVLPRRALAVAYSTALPGARASTFARPTAPRAYCRVIYRLARRAGVDVRAPYRVARLLSRILPPRQARGARLPCHDVKNTRARARRAAPSDCRCGQEGSRGTPPRRSLKEDERLQVCQKNRFGVKGRRPFHRTWIFFPPTTSAGQAPTGGSSWRGCLQGLTGQHGLRTPGFCSPRALDRPGSDRGTIPRGRATPGARVARVLYRLARRARASLAYYTALPSARASTFARPAASRLLLRVLPPRQARGRRR